MILFLLIKKNKKGKVSTHQYLLPEREIIAEAHIDVVGLEVPEGLVLEPFLDVCRDRFDLVINDCVCLGKVAALERGKEDAVVGSLCGKLVLAQTDAVARALDAREGKHDA